MDNPKSAINIDQDFELLLPSKRQEITVPLQDWKRYVARLEQSADQTDTYHAIGWACIGFAGSALLTAIAFPFSVQWTVDGAASVTAIVVEVSFIATTAAAGIIGGVTLKYAHQHHQDRSALRKLIAEEMKAYAATCKKKVAVQNQS